MELHDLEIYKLSRDISKKAGELSQTFEWQIMKNMGDQWLRAVDSIGANIAEGFGRYHYLDKNKFHFYARGSLFEAIHWTELLAERNKITLEDNEYFQNNFKTLGIKLNNYISKIKKDAN